MNVKFNHLLSKFVKICQFHLMLLNELQNSQKLSEVFLKGEVVAYTPKACFILYKNFIGKLEIMAKLRHCSEA